MTEDQHSVGYGPPSGSGSRRIIHVSQDKTFLSDLAEYFDGDEEVSEVITIVTKLFKAEKWTELATEYNDHTLTRELTGYRSLHLFPESDKDVVLVYKRITNWHVVFHRIGNHNQAYHPDYADYDKERQMKKKHRGN